MNVMSKLSDIAREPGDPKVLSTGPSSFGAADQLARGLGWFSIGLGLAEIVAARRLTRALGMEGREALVRAYGMRELAAGVLSLSSERRRGIQSRVVGDALDLATLAVARGHDNPKRENVDLAVAAVLGVTLLDLLCTIGLEARHARGRGAPRDYGDRNGLPRGVEASRGLARSARPPEMPAPPRLAAEIAPAPAS